MHIHNPLPRLKRHFAKSRSFITTLQVVAVLSFLWLCLCCLLYLFGFRLNISDSLPRGLWRPVHSTSLERGDVVLFCLPPSPYLSMAKERHYLPPGVCPGGVYPLLKPIAALPGDYVTVDPTGIAVNGQPISQTQILDHDRQGGALSPFKRGEWKLPAGMMFVISNFSPQSWDSRYFGPVPLSAVQQQMRLL